MIIKDYLPFVGEKARNIRKYNLGKKKLNNVQKKVKSSLTKEINTALNELNKKEPSMVVSEALSNAFSFKYYKKANRRLSAWVRGLLNERLKFKALAKGFSHQQVNPAYTSQTCDLCNYVDSNNRKGDRFLCLFCGHVGHANRVAAINLRRRYYDLEITRYMPYRDVKKVLQNRFHRHLETDNKGTVSGRIPEPHYNDSHIGGQSESEYLKTY